MPRFRKVERVEAYQANLAYVGIPSLPSDNMIDIVDPNRSTGAERRRIMYGDISGRLVDLNGDPTVNVAYPVVTDKFFDPNSNKELDADEVVAEAALPYRYRSSRTYYGKAVYPTDGPPREQKLIDTGSYKFAFNDKTCVISGCTLTPDVHVGNIIRLTEMVWSLTEFFDAPTVTGMYRTIVANTATTITYDSPFFPEESAVISAISSASFVEYLPLTSEAPLFSLVGTENIRLVHADGSQYKGHNVLMLQRAGTQSEVVVANGVEYATSYVHVFLDRDDVDLYLKFPSASISSNGTGGYERAGDIDINHMEPVNAFEMFRYASMDSATDPANEGKDIVASVPLGLSHGIYVTDRAFVDNRIIDPLMWRIRADVSRTTPVKSDTGQGTLSIGVIGDVPSSLNTFLQGDPTYLFRMTCDNPFPRTRSGSSSHFEIDPERVSDWSKYDVVIYRSWNIKWSRIFQIATAVVNGGGIFIMDSHDRNIMIDADRVAGDRELNVPTNLALKATFTPVSNVTGISLDSVIKEVEGGYTLSDNDIKAIFPNTEHSSIAFDAAVYPTRRTFLSGTASGTKKFVVEMQKGILLSTIGFTEVDNEPTKQFFCNIVWGYSAEDPTRTITNATLVKTLYSPWETSWVAGWNVDGEPVLSDNEIVRHGFRKQLDETSGEKRLVRRLSDKTASTIMSEAMVAKGESDFLNGADSIVYSIELAGHDPAYVDSPNKMDSSSYPEAWSHRDDSPVFDVQGGYLIKSYLEEPTPGTVPGGPVGVDATVRVVGTMVTLEETEFTFSMSQGYSYDTRYTVTKEVPLTSGSGYVDLVTTWSDVEWTAPNIWKDHNVRSKYNLEHYGHHGITATKWYPWDGQSFLAAHSSNHGDYVKYVQKALNALHEAGRSQKHGILKVDGSYGPKTQAAVRAYQTDWNLTADGDVDAGTCGHLLRNAGSVTSWASLDDRWKKYGPLNNMIDGSDKTYGGRRTWINSHVTRLVDKIYIKLKNGMQVTKIEIEPYNLGDGSERYLHIYKVGGRRDADHRKHDWSFNHSKHMGSAWKIKTGSTDSRKLTLPNDLDLITVGLYQDNPYTGRARQWGVKNVIAYGKVTSTDIRTEYNTLKYNPKLKVQTAAHTIGTETTITTVGPHGYKVGDEIWLAGFATSGVNGKWRISAVLSSTVFKVPTTPVSTTTEANVENAVCRNLAIKLRTGEKKTITLQPTLPPHSTFKGWDAATSSGNADAIAAAIKTSLSPSYLSQGSASDRIDVSVVIGSSGVLHVTFYSPLENVDSERSIGREFNVHMGPNQLYGLDSDTEPCTTSSAATTTVTDNTKYWPVSSLAGGKITFTSGDLNGQTFNIANNTASQISTIENMSPASSVDDTFIVKHPRCDTGAVALTAGVGSGLSTIVIPGAGYSIDSMIGMRVLFTSGVNDRKNSVVVSNTATSITIADALTVSNNDPFLLLTGHWPAFDKVDEDVAFIINYRVDVVLGKQKVMGIFAIVNSDGDVTDILSSISLSDVKKYGIDSVKIGVTNLHLWGDPSIGGLDRFPVRYAMKPFCVIEKSHGTLLDVKGLSGDQPSEIWGLLIESATVRNNIRIPDGLCSSPDGENNISAYATLIQDAKTKIATCIYNVSTGTYSPAYGEPFVDIIDEKVEVDDWKRIAQNHLVVGTSAMAPIHVSDSGVPVITAKLNGQTDDISVSGADIDRGSIFFTITKIDYDPANDDITIDYTYREQYVAYKGSGVTGESLDVLDLCPYHGHVTSTPDGIKNTTDLIGKPIYVYAMPTTVKVDSTVITNSRCLNHTTYAPMFDDTSPFYNPFAMLLAVVTIKGIGTDVDITLIDTRTGGGGVVDPTDMNTEVYRHRCGFYESQGFFDIGHLDGDAFLLGGSVVIEVPLGWREAWLEYGQDIDSMISEFCSRWLAPGKTHTIVWRDDTVEPD